MTRQLDQEIIEATDELKDDVQLTHAIVTGDENTVVEVSPGNRVRSPKKMIEDTYAETQTEIGERFGSLEQAVSDATTQAGMAMTEANRATTEADKAQLSANSAGASASSASGSKVAAQNSETAAAGSASSALGSKNSASQSQTAAASSASAAKASENAAAQSQSSAAASASVAQSSETASQQAQSQAEQARDDVLPLAPAISQLQMQGGRKNLLINGNFIINQRGLGSYGDTVSGICVDRWRKWRGGKVNRAFNTSYSMYYLHLRKTASSDPFYALTQAVEDGVIACNGKPLVLSFMIRANKAGSGLYAHLRDDTIPKTFGSKPYSIAQANTWQKMEFAFDPYSATTTSKNMTVYVVAEMESFFTAADDWIEIMAVQLEIGETSTEFEVVHPGTELALCQRYYFRDPNYQTAYLVNGSSSTTFRKTDYFPVPMRVKPTITYLYLSDGSHGDTLTIPSNNNAYGSSNHVEHRLNGSFANRYALYMAEYNAEI